MVEILKPTEIGVARLDHFTIEKDDIASLLRGIPSGTYARLRLNGRTIMSDTPMEYRENDEFIRSCFGDVLIGGLGIGMVLMEIQDKECVNTITVIENSQDVIDIVAPQLPLNDKVTIICDDVFTYEPTETYDTIYLDIWDHINSVIYEREMMPLNEKYRDYLKSMTENPKRSVSCWAQYSAEHNRHLV
jgi:hypothetical protein